MASNVFEPWQSDEVKAKVMEKLLDTFSTFCVEVTRSAPIAASFPPVGLDKLGSILRTDLRRGQLLQGDPCSPEVNPKFNPQAVAGPHYHRLSSGCR